MPELRATSTEGPTMSLRDWFIYTTGVVVGLVAMAVLMLVTEPSR